MQRRQDRHKRGPVFRFMRGFVNFFRSYRKWSNKGFVAILLLAVALSMGLVLLFEKFPRNPLDQSKKGCHF
ncbi:Capsule biosynthesis protein capA [Streptococcus mitis]|uniref:Capsule biosynthesis protein capA n=1 Tax=Streptococcus mitis TaxID=28037 RepID=A0A150NX46_STRMT|nr:Capsule biosynthesis protein capA [Streptococcus mitis]